MKISDIIRLGGFFLSGEERYWLGIGISRIFSGMGLFLDHCNVLPPKNLYENLIRKFFFSHAYDPGNIQHRVFVF